MIKVSFAETERNSRPSGDLEDIPECEFETEDIRNIRQRGLAIKPIPRYAKYVSQEPGPYLKYVDFDKRHEFWKAFYAAEDDDLLRYQKKVVMDDIEKQKRREARRRRTSEADKERVEQDEIPRVIRPIPGEDRSERTDSFMSKLKRDIGEPVRPLGSSHLLTPRSQVGHEKRAIRVRESMMVSPQTARELAEVEENGEGGSGGERSQQ
jgi:hypothetical protein